MELPNSLAWMERSEPGRTWLQQLPAVLSSCVQQWHLRLGDPYPDSYVSLTIPVFNRLGEGLVLKIQFPDRESQFEAQALELWDGNGAVRVVDTDDELRAILIEQCQPGHHLSTTGPEAGLGVLINLLPRLWIPADRPFSSLADEVDSWITNLPGEYERAGEPFERNLLDEIVTTLGELATSQGEQVLLHQDLHGDNVLSARREPWLVIDPKPLVGEREFGLSPIIRSAEFGHSKEHVLHRLNRLTGELGLDRDRARLWAAGQAVAWGFENGEALPGHIETARWLLAG